MICPVLRRTWKVFICSAGILCMWDICDSLFIYIDFNFYRWPQGPQAVWTVPQGPQGSHPVRQNVPGGNTGCGIGTTVGPHGPWQSSVGVKYNIDGGGQVL